MTRKEISSHATLEYKWKLKKAGRKGKADGRDWTGTSRTFIGEKDVYLPFEFPIYCPVGFNGIVILPPSDRRGREKLGID